MSPHASRIYCISGTEVSPHAYTPAHGMQLVVDEKQLGGEPFGCRACHVLLCVRERKRAREFVSLCVCVCERVSVCAFFRERERERERENA